MIETAIDGILTDLDEKNVKSLLTIAAPKISNMREELLRLLKAISLKMSDPLKEDLAEILLNEMNKRDASLLSMKDIEEILEWFPSIKIRPSGRVLNAAVAATLGLTATNLPIESLREFLQTITLLESTIP